MTPLSLLTIPKASGRSMYLLMKMATGHLCAWDDSRIILDVVAQHTDIAEEEIEYLHQVGHLLPILLTNNLKFYLWRGWLPASKMNTSGTSFLTLSSMARPLFLGLPFHAKLDGFFTVSTDIHFCACWASNQPITIINISIWSIPLLLIAIYY